MELFNSVTVAMALSVILLITVVLPTAGDARESWAAATRTSAEPTTTPPEDYNTSPSLRRLARANVMHGGDDGNNHTEESGHSDHAGKYPEGCRKHPEICHKGRRHHRLHCCGDKCVDLRTDELHCGKCQRKCKYRFKCCHGRCADVMNDRNNCGSCRNKCKKVKCVYGMCGYGV